MKLTRVRLFRVRLMERLQVAQWQYNDGLALMYIYKYTNVYHPPILVLCPCAQLEDMQARLQSEQRHYNDLVKHRNEEVQELRRKLQLEAERYRELLDQKLALDKGMELLFIMVRESVIDRCYMNLDVFAISESQARNYYSGSQIDTMFHLTHLCDHPHVGKPSAEMEYYSRLLDDEFNRLGLEGNKRSAPTDGQAEATRGTVTKRRRVEETTPASVC